MLSSVMNPHPACRRGLARTSNRFASSRAPTVRSGLMDELLLARKEVLLSSPCFVLDRFVMEDIREGRLWVVSSSA